MSIGWVCELREELFEEEVVICNVSEDYRIVGEVDEDFQGMACPSLGVFCQSRRTIFIESLLRCHQQEL